MKLYATTTSERASKGQGGNEYLYIDILTESNIKQYRVNVNFIDKVAILELYEYATGRNVFTKALKGNKQKTAKCAKCKDTEKGLTEHNDGKLYCDDCWY